jgi:hypothetical protein
VEGNGGGRGGPPAEGTGEVDGEVHRAAVELEEAETGLKDGRSGPSAWRCLAADGEPVIEAACGWVGELRGAIPELGDGSAGPGSGRRELVPVRYLMVGWAVAES